MLTMTKCLYGAALGLVLLCLTPLQAAAQHSLRFGFGLAEDSNQGRAAHVFAQELARRSAGKLQVKTLPNGVLGDDARLQRALQNGELELAVVSTATVAAVASDFGVFDLPFLFSSEREADTLLDGSFGQRLRAQLPDQGLIGLVYWENGFRHLSNNRREIQQIDDLKGIKLRVMANPVYVEMFKAFGAQTQALPFAELYGALASGRVDGQENPLNTIVSSKFYQVQKYLTLTRHVYSPWLMLASARWWNKLSSEERLMVQQAAEVARDFERRDSRAAASRAADLLRQKGMQITIPSEQEMERMRELTRPAFYQFARDGHVALIKQLQAELERHRK